MFYTLAKLFWLLANPLNLALILLCLSVLLLWSRWRRLGLWSVSLVAASLLALAILPLGEWLLSPLNNQFASFESSNSKIDGIILLSGGAVALKTSRQLGHAVPGKAADRLVEFMSLAKAHPNAKLLICGGNVESGADVGEKRQTEALLIAKYLINRGLSATRILVEDRSLDTFENAVLGHQLARPRADQRWLLVTSAWHMSRALASFQAQDWPVIAAPSGVGGKMAFRLRLNLKAGLKSLDIAIHEYIGLLAYRLNGRIATIWPAS